MISVAYAALWIFVFSLPWESVLFIPGLGLISRVMGMAAACIAVLAAVVSGRFRRWHPFHVAALLYVMWCAAVLLFYGGGPKLPNKFWTWPQLLLVLWMIWELAPQKRAVQGLLFAYVCGAYVAAIDTILLYRRAAAVLRRFSAGGADANDIAMTLVLAIPMAWYLGMTYRQPILRWACRAYVPVCLVALGLTGSRGGMVATVVALLIIPLTMIRLTPGRLVTAMLVLGVGGGLAVAYTPETLMQRLASTRTEVEQGRLGGRFRLWRAGIFAFAERPLAGYGTGGFRGAVSQRLGSGTQVAHNSYISVLVEQGLIGFLLYLAMFVAVFRAVRRQPILERRYALVLMATLGVVMLPLTWEDKKQVWFVLAALVGLAQAHAAAGMDAIPDAAPVRWPGMRPASATRPLGPMTAPGGQPRRDLTG